MLHIFDLFLVQQPHGIGFNIFTVPPPALRFILTQSSNGLISGNFGIYPGLGLASIF